MLRPRKAMFLILAVAFSTKAFSAEFKAGEILVKYKDGVLRTRAQSNALYDSIGVTSVKRYTGFISGFEHLVLSDQENIQQAVERLKSDHSVAYAQPNYILHAIGTRDLAQQARPVQFKMTTPCWFIGIEFPAHCGDHTQTVASAQPAQVSRPVLNDAPAEVIPTVVDPDLSQVWGLDKIGATTAWKTWQGSKDFIVADIDTGIDYNHEDLAFNLWRNPHPGTDQDIVGYDFVHNDGLPYDDQEHGTHTAGSIGAVGGNGIGISGVAARVSLMSLKFLSSDGSGTTSDAIRAIDYAISHGAKVLSNSWGGPSGGDNQALKEAVDRAQAKGVLFVAAAGNDGADNDDPSSASYPAAFDSDNMISVAATDDSDSLAYFSNYGKKSVHVAAPGVGIYSTVPGNRYASLDGTSMACPHVAGAAALVWSKHPSWTYKQVRDALFKTVDQITELADKTVTGGRINVLKALAVN